MSGNQPPAPLTATLTLSPNPAATPGSVPVIFTVPGADYDGSVPSLSASGANSSYVNLTQFNSTPTQGTDANGNPTYTFAGALIAAAHVTGSGAPVQCYVNVEGQQVQEIDITVVEGAYETGAVTLGPVNPPEVQTS